MISARRDCADRDRPTSGCDSRRRPADCSQRSVRDVELVSGRRQHHGVALRSCDTTRRRPTSIGGAPPRDSDWDSAMRARAALCDQRCDPCRVLRPAAAAVAARRRDAGSGRSRVPATPAAGGEAGDPAAERADAGELRDELLHRAGRVHPDRDPAGAAGGAADLAGIVRVAVRGRRVRPDDVAGGGVPGPRDHPQLPAEGPGQLRASTRRTPPSSGSAADRGATWPGRSRSPGSPQELRVVDGAAGAGRRLLRSDVAPRVPVGCGVRNSSSLVGEVADERRQAEVHELTRVRRV